MRVAAAKAEMQTDLTRSQVEIEIAKNRGEAELAQGRLRAQQVVVDAEAESQRQVLVAESEGRAKVLVGEGESRRLSLEGEARASVLRKQIQSYGDPRLYALSVVARELAQSHQPLVPEQLFVTGSGHNGDGRDREQSPLGVLMQLLLAEKVGFQPAPSTEAPADGDLRKTG